MTKLWGITATGTDVGKTGLAAALLLWGHQQGLRVAYHKPVQCGLAPLPGGQGKGGDADFIAAKLNLPVTYLTSVSLKLAASPHLAAESQHQKLNAGLLAADSLNLASSHDLTLVEGAGGPAVPFSRQGWGLLDLPLPSIRWILACSPGLGTLHHSRATVAYMQSQGAEIAGFFFCHTEAEISDLAEDNRATLEDLLAVPCLGELPYLATWNQAGALSPSHRQTWCRAMHHGAQHLMRLA
jgi:dethiobiotin synthetase